MYTLVAYLIYLSFSLFTVFVVGRNLHKNGLNYLFGECPDESLSKSANNFLYVGYCLLNSAFALFFLRTAQRPGSFSEVAEFLAGSQGIICLCLGILHILNLLIVPRIINYLLKKKLLTNKSQKS